ncbi:4'-phosphopantetheinyl transferase family protein [Streptomyces pathocidini]|uniref:4'-phosphopantetheinyl transferase family protein n=1 Tax=Streptomyces pathocidini TaxID=1650571 RepID=UPI000AB88346|nr:4'-phosphopantetheinyl transferase superfamily protein [Streptomyces pathocidini]
MTLRVEPSVAPAPRHPEPWQVADGVWLAVAAYADGSGAALPSERAQAVGMPDWRAREFLAGRGVLRALLESVAPYAATATVVRDRRGKPHLAGHPDLGVSVSHDGGTAAAAVATGRAVGVDVQHPPAGGAAPALARRCLRGHHDTLARLPAAGAAAELAWVWTAQEACVKATGQGVAGRPWEIDVPLGGRAGTWREHRWLSLREHSATPLSCAFSQEER